MTSSYNEWYFVCKSSHPIVTPPPPPPPLPCRTWKKNKIAAAVHVDGYENGPDESALKSPTPSAQTPGPVSASASYIISTTSSMLDSEKEKDAIPLPLSFHLTFFTSLTDATVHRSSPQAQRRDIGLAVTHRSAATFDLFRLLVMLCHRCLRGRTYVQFILIVLGGGNRWFIKD